MIISGVRSTTVDLSIGVPQRSALGPLPFLVYVIPLRSVIERHRGVRHHGYADDRQLYTQFHLRDQDSYRQALQLLERCVEEAGVCMLTSKLKINSDKTEFMVHRAVNRVGSVYLRSLVTPYTPGRSLCSSCSLLLARPKARDAASPPAAAVLWNNPPLALRQIQDETSFKTALKAYTSLDVHIVFL